MSIILLFFKVGFIIHILIKNCCIQIQAYARINQLYSHAIIFTCLKAKENTEKKEISYIVKILFIFVAYYRRCCDIDPAS